MNLLNKIKIRLCCNEIGIDEFGNTYFEENLSKEQKKRRFVIYKGETEPSKIPSSWHGWLHYSCNTPPINVNTYIHSWQKTHLPNLTGTIYQHCVSSSANKKGNRKKVGSDYEAWNPRDC